MGKPIGLTASQTSSASSVYGNADKDWLKQIGAGVVEFLKDGPLGITKWFREGILGLAGKVFNSVKRGTFFSDVQRKFKEMVDGSKKIGAIVQQGGEVIGALNSPQARGLTALATASGGALAGATLLGAGPELMQALIRLTQLTYNFNWQESDAQIEAQIEAQITALYGPAGEAAGRTVASLLTGGGFAVPRLKFNMTAITTIWQVNEEAREEMLAGLTNLSQMGIRAAQTILFKQVYRNIRKMIKKLAKDDPNNPLVQFLGGPEALAAWGEKGSEPWSMALFVEEKIEELQKDDQRLGNFAEGFMEGFFEDGLAEFLPELVRQPI